MTGTRPDMVLGVWHTWLSFPGIICTIILTTICSPPPLVLVGYVPVAISDAVRHGCFASVCV